MKKGKKMQKLFPPTCEHDLAFVTATRRAGVIEEALRQRGIAVEVRPDLRQQYYWQVTPAHTWDADGDLPDLAPFAAELALALDVEAVAVQHDPYDSVCNIYEQFEIPRPPCAGPCVIVIENPAAALYVALRALDAPPPPSGSFAPEGVFILEYADAEQAQQALTRLTANTARLARLLDVQECVVVKITEGDPAWVKITVVYAPPAEAPATPAEPAPAAG